jgi:beta-lactamase regulating signal transducer with metallopeptidase domain
MTHTLQAVAWTLIHFCWQAAAVATIYRLVSAAVARRSSQTRYLVALAALLLMVVSAGATFAWELRDGSSSSPALATAGANLQAAISTPGFPVTMAPGFVSASTDLHPSSVDNLLPWIDGLWVLGVVVLSARSFGGWWLIKRLRASATSQAPAAVRESFQRICSAMGLSRPVLLRVSSAIAGPMTVGAFRALVLLPITAATSLSAEELEVVLAHELAHVRRADFLWNLMQTLAETLFFFHPAVWWISARIRHERELCCDDLALEICPDPIVYAHALYRLEEHRSREWRLAMALDGHQSPQTLRMRISRILGEPVTNMNSRNVRPLSLAAASAALLVLLLPVPQLLAGLSPSPQVAPTPVVANRSVATVDVRPIVAVNIKHLAAPSPRPLLQAATPSPAPEPTLAASIDAQSEDRARDSAKPGSNYIDRMKAAGYDVDLDKLIAMKMQNVTPEYAHDMAQLGFGKPSADDLVACKMQGVTPEYIAQVKQQGFEVKSLQDAIAYRMFQVTPEFVSSMKAAGFEGLTSKQLLSMRVQGITPEYARDIKRQFPGATAEDVLKTRIFNIDAAFIAAAQKHGFNNLSLEKLVQLRISGLLDDESVKP